MAGWLQKKHKDDIASLKNLIILDDCKLIKKLEIGKYI